MLSNPEAGEPPQCLSVADAYDLELRAELVTLSACDSAAGELAGGEGPLGLPRGFLVAGASSVVSSLWRSHDEATRELMADFYRAMARGTAPAAALREAQNLAPGGLFAVKAFLLGWVRVSGGLVG